MAGSYPDAPFRRMAYDEDGSIFWYAAATALTYTSTILPGVERTVVEKGYTNNERTLSAAGERITTGGGGGSLHWAFHVIFPELRDIYGLNFWSMAANVNPNGNFQDLPDPYEIQVSADTTNGISGTWTSLWATSTYPMDTPIYTYTWDHWYRVGIVSSSPLPVTGKRAIRWLQPIPNGLIANSQFHHIHIYGDKATGATPDRLLFIDWDTGLEFTAPLDWGDVPRGTVLHHEIKIKNNSATLTANTIVLDFEALTGTSDTWHTISDSGGAFGGTANVASLAPGASYPAADVYTIKLTVGDAENLGLQACRLQATTVSWT